MSNERITDLVGGTCKSTDLHVAVDTTDTSMAPTGTDKKYALSAIKVFNNTAITEPTFATAGLVHNAAGGLFSSSLLVDADITANTITNASRAQMPLLTIKGNNTGGTSNEDDLTVTEVQTMLGLTGVPGVNEIAACRLCASIGFVVTYNNGTGGVGATLTNAGVQVALNIDNVAATVGDRVLMAAQSSSLQNGIYEVTDIGSGATNWILTRTTDYDNDTNIHNGDFVTIEQGLVHSNTGWMMDAVGPITVGTSDIEFGKIAPDGAELTQIQACRVVATSNLTATYNNGTGGIGAKLTNAGAQSALVIDGVTLSASDRVLIAGQSNTFENGIYTVTDVGSGATNWVITRDGSYNQSFEIKNGDFVKITAGTTNPSSTWVLCSRGIVNVGVSPMTFGTISEASVGGAATLTATYVGFGDGSNVLTGSANMTWTDSSTELNIGGGAADATAMLQLNSTTQLFYPPRMTTAQRTGITANEGGMCFDTDLKQWFGWNNTAWAVLG